MVQETILTAEKKVEFIGHILKPIFSDIVLAIIVLLVGIILGRIAGKFIQTILHALELNKIIRIKFDIRIRLEQFIGTIITYFVYFISFVLALDILKLTGIIVYLLALSVIVVIVISILMSIKDFMPNIVAGVLLQRRKRARIGATIQFRDIKGKIIQRSLLETRIQTTKGDIFNVPNSLFMKELMVKFKTDSSKVK